MEEKHYLFLLEPLNQSGPRLPITSSGATSNEAASKVALRHHSMHILLVGEVNEVLELLRPHIILSQHVDI